MKIFWKKYALLVLITGSVILLDQVTKSLVHSQIETWAMRGPYNLLGVEAYLVHMPNTGMMMNLFQGYGTYIIILGLIVAAVLIYYFPRLAPANWPARIGLALMLGGILGNILDRLFYGYITDFIHIGQLPVFNLADIAVYSGVIFLAVGLLRSSPEAKDKPEPGNQLG